MTRLSNALRPLPAQALYLEMEKERLRIGRLSEISGVSKTYIDYLRKYASDHSQIEYLMHKIKNYNSFDYNKTVKLEVTRSFYDAMKSTGEPLSVLGKKAFSYWREKNGY